MDILNETSSHANVTQVLNNYAGQIVREQLRFHGLLTVVLFPENIESNFILIPPLKKFEITKVAANYVM